MSIYGIFHWFLSPFSFVEATDFSLTSPEIFDRFGAAQKAERRTPQLDVGHFHSYLHALELGLQLSFTGWDDGSGSCHI